MTVNNDLHKYDVNKMHKIIMKCNCLNKVDYNNKMHTYYLNN